MHKNALQSSLQLGSHPINTNSHDPNVLMNIYSGEVPSDKINVDIAESIGETEMKKFQHILLDGFYSKVHKKDCSHGQGKRKIIE